MMNALRPGLTLWFLLLAWLATPAHAENRPNILFLFADDWGRYASLLAEVDGPGGINDVVRTPNFDAIARRGVFFRNAHVSAPSCTPCRSALLTGRHFWEDSPVNGTFATVVRSVSCMWAQAGC